METDRNNESDRFPTLGTGMVSGDLNWPGVVVWVFCNHVGSRRSTMGFSSGIGGPRNRVNNIAACATPSSTDIFAAYTYLGDGTIVGVSSRRAGTTRASGKSATRMCIVRRAPSGSEVCLAVTSRERKRAG
jgi:hypothetical protein